MSKPRFWKFEAVVPIEAKPGELDEEGEPRECFVSDYDYERIERELEQKTSEVESLMETISDLRLAMCEALEAEHCGGTSCPRPTRKMCSSEAHQILYRALEETAEIETRKRK